jgi:hypothetical protein
MVGIIGYKSIIIIIAWALQGPVQLDFTIGGLKLISEGHSFHYTGAPYKYLYGGAPYKLPKIAENRENPSFRPTSEGHSYYHRP